MEVYTETFEMADLERPIIICGPARAGTTAVRGLLNSHADFLIAGEVPQNRLPSLEPLLAELAEYQENKWTVRRRAEVVRGLWFAASLPAGNRTNTRRWGMKTPWSELEAELWNSLVNPLYVYALRRGDRVFRSHIKLGWNIARSPDRLLARYKESLRTGREMRDQGQAHIVQLDLADNQSDRWKLASNLFAFLDEEPDSGVEKFVEEWPTHWSQPTTRGGSFALPADWQELLAHDAEYNQLMADHGYAPTS